MDKLALLGVVEFGRQVAEDEGELLQSYFVETDLWTRLLAGEIDVVYGAKGSGKSALYSLLVRNKDTLFDRGILLAAGENPRGAPAFRDLAIDPPASEREFIGLWKLYLACLCLRGMEEFGVSGAERDALKDALAQEGLAESSISLQAVVRGVKEYARRVVRPKSVEGGLDIDPVSGLPKGISGRITFEQPTPAERKAGLRSVDELLGVANEGLERAGYSLWILLDRLDVAFLDSPDLEQNALRALFHVYLDMLALNSLRLKIFLRTDIWRRITTGGFREASHITRNRTISWNPGSLLNLVVKRAIQNKLVQEHYGAAREEVLATAKAQEMFFYRMCPEQVDVGPNKPRTFDWMLSRTRDGLGENAPRELIHFLNSLREVQVRRLEIGGTEPDGENLFARATFKEALPEVSRVRLEQTLYAEYPAVRPFVEQLRGSKTSQRTETLAGIWKLGLTEAAEKAQELVDVGFFEKRAQREDSEYWVPFLYRDALDMIQGAAE